MARQEVAPNEILEIDLGPVTSAEPTDQLTVRFASPSGVVAIVPAFTSAGRQRVRYAPDTLGIHRWRAVGRTSSRTGEVRVRAGHKSTSLATRGALRIASDGTHLEHLDGTPFLWLADTWWHGFTMRLSLEEFQHLAAQRVRQGFSAVQIVAGLYPEMPPFSPEGKSLAGWPWNEGFDSINEAWFDEADRRIQVLVAQGLVPCIVGSWAYYLQFMSTNQLVRHWREIIARWGAYPVVWCLAGEPSLLWAESVEKARPELVAEALREPDTQAATHKLRKAFQAPIRDQLAKLNEVARAVRTLEPFGRLITIHSVPYANPWEFLDSDELVDFWMLQTGHEGLRTLEPSLLALHEALRRQPTKPVINGEVNYEGIGGTNWHDIQRFLFWSHMLTGAAGHSYGAHGVWAFNTPEIPGLCSGLAPDWRSAATFNGAAHLGLGRRILSKLPWNELHPQPDYVEPHQTSQDRFLPYAAASAADGLRVYYFPSRSLYRNALAWGSVELRQLGNRSWRAQLIDPRTGDVHLAFTMEPTAAGTAALELGYRGQAPLPSWDDWLLLIEPHTACRSGEM